jgi:hypothetical protein
MPFEFCAFLQVNFYYAKDSKMKHFFTLLLTQKKFTVRRVFSCPRIFRFCFASKIQPLHVTLGEQATLESLRDKKKILNDVFRL